MRRNRQQGASNIAAITAKHLIPQETSQEIIVAELLPLIAMTEQEQLKEMERKLIDINQQLIILQNRHRALTDFRVEYSKHLGNYGNPRQIANLLKKLKK